MVAAALKTSRRASNLLASSAKLAVKPKREGGGRNQNKKVAPPLCSSGTTFLTCNQNLPADNVGRGQRLEETEQEAVRSRPQQAVEGLPGAGGGHAGDPHHMQHEREEVHSGGLQPAQ